MKAKAMKRKGNLYEAVCSLENLQKAAAIARIGKKHRADIKAYDLNADANLLELRDMLLQKEFSTSNYIKRIIKDPKEREISKLPFYPDQIVHWGIMNVAGGILINSFTSHSYASIKGKGVHAACNAVDRALRDVPATTYCLKIDVRKFYDNVDHDILKALIRRKIKDADLLWLLDEIIGSAPGLPIGNLLSGLFANLYLNGLDHYIKETLRVRYHFRYMDDMILLSGSKPYLHKLLADIRAYLKDHLNLELKKSYQIFPVDARGINFLGYVKFHGYTLLRPRNKKSFARAVAKCSNIQSIASHLGWASHANTNHLVKKLLYDNEKFQRLQHKTKNKGFHRTEHRSGGHPQTGDNSPRLQNRTVQISREIRVLPATADKL